MEHNATTPYLDAFHTDALSQSKCLTLPETSLSPEREHLLSLTSIRLAKSFRDGSRGNVHDSPIEPPHIPSLPSIPSLSCPPSPEPLAPKPKRIPRPPNAFMLFRSDLIKNGRIPKEVEHRQQTLSCVAGECWNMLREEERKEWQAKAAEKLREHQQKYPNYKFTPSPKGNSKKGKGKNDAAESKDRVRALREKYMHLSGPAQPARRRRMKKANRYEYMDDLPSGTDSSSESSHTPLMSPITPPPMMQPFHYLSREYDSTPSLPATFPYSTMPHYFEDRRQMPTVFIPEEPMANVYFNQLPPRPPSEPCSVASSAPSSDSELAQRVGALEMEPAGSQLHQPVPTEMAYTNTMAYAMRYNPTFSTLNNAVMEQSYQPPLLTPAVVDDQKEAPMMSTPPYLLYNPHDYQFQHNSYVCDNSMEYGWQDEVHGGNV
ncbi:hypothetical protein VNI00_005610 [Paramarasmius palmivorus]|uniref:HMG box domain-containing protein n=1 Tax=Paramarasmius palmivorus TaxID=297713 RepID=A0AAW0DDB3_9AGAR